MNKVKSRVNLSICTCPHYAKPNVASFKKKYPDWEYVSSAIYVNDRRISGPRDYNGRIIFDAVRCGKHGVSTLEILRALEIPDEIINQIEFEENILD